MDTVTATDISITSDQTTAAMRGVPFPISPNTSPISAVSAPEGKSNSQALAAMSSSGF